MQRKKRAPRQLMHGQAREGGGWRRGVGGAVGGIIEGETEVISIEGRQSRFERVSDRQIEDEMIRLFFCVNVNGSINLLCL